MPTQADFQKITKHIIEPMKRHWGADFDSDTIADFVDDLARFPAETLIAAMADLRREQKRRPALAHVFSACKKAEPAGGGIYQPGSDQNAPWEIRANKIKTLVNEYILKFKNISPIYRESVREGWDLSLLKYIHAVAFVQAQMIAGEKNIGWDGAIIFDHGEITDAQAKIFLRDQRTQADTGDLDVAIPTGHIASWRKHADWLKAHNAKAAAPRQSAPTPDAPKTALDEEIARQLAAKVA